jgi:CDP-4-dehydro-6-deoxyglucose reductase, E1
MWKLQENILEQKDKEILIEFINKEDRFTQHKKVKEFESKWCEWQNCSFSTFVNSGSSADLIMLDAVKELYSIPDGAEVLVPAVTWSTNISSVIQAKMKPVFIDVNLTDLSFDYEKIESAVSLKTKIILVTHLIGIPADMERIAAIAKKFNLIVLEDCCESHGAKFGNKKVGNFGFASTFSFYWGHHFTSIEGGVVCTENEDLNDLIILKRSHGLARELDQSKHKKYREAYPDVDFNFLFLTHGYNFRNTEFNAVLGIEQLKHLDRYIEIRNKNHKNYIKILETISEKIHIIDHEGISSFCLPFIFKDKHDKDIFQSALQQYKIESRPVIGANLLRQPCFAQYAPFSAFTNAELVHSNGLYIGNNQFVNDERLCFLGKIVKEVFA